MEMPRLTEAHKDLERFAGTWHGEEKLYPTPWDENGGQATGRMCNRLALDGFAIVQDYEQERNGEVNFRGHGVLTWDVDHAEYAFYWFDSMGMPPSIFTGCFNGDVITLVNHQAMGHTRATFDFSESGSYAYRMEVSGDGSEWFPSMEAKYGMVDVGIAQ